MAGEAPAGGSEREIAGAAAEILGGFMESVRECAAAGFSARLHAAACQAFPPQGTLSPETAKAADLTRILGFIEDSVGKARMGCRRKLRTQALGAMQKLYESHHDGLRSTGLEEAVQSAYQRLTG